jgi:hypothetical protein
MRSAIGRPAPEKEPGGNGEYEYAAEACHLADFTKFHAQKTGNRDHLAASLFRLASVTALEQPGDRIGPAIPGSAGFQVSKPLG